MGALKRRKIRFENLLTRTTEVMLGTNLFKALAAGILIAFAGLGYSEVQTQRRPKLETENKLESKEVKKVVTEEKHDKKITTKTKVSKADVPVTKKESPEVTWKDNPKNCNQETHWIAAEKPFKCIEKPKPVNTTPKAKKHDTQATARSGGDCAAEIRKYGWGQTTAHNVMMAESGGSATVVNDNPATGDYSVGCFQVNIYGANARNRPSESQLKNAAINVKWAYNNYVANGHSFIGQWGVCRKISCY